ncbi:hypothetical protein DL98DRAFT_521415 [Cadophora sp. DSE1049]|nr:hypothetical protein DL98DRAFT_521415 [Cadophora sp. DSE1049]
MSSIVPVSERPSRLFIEGFWSILEGIHFIFIGITLITKGTSTLFAAIILNAGLLFAIVVNALILPPAFIFVIGTSEIYKLVFGTRNPGTKPEAALPVRPQGCLEWTASTYHKGFESEVLQVNSTDSHPNGQR